MTADAPVVDTAEQAEFQSRVRSFLQAHAEPRAAGGDRSEDEDDGGLFEEVEPEAEQRRIAEAQAFQAALFDAGLAGITWPKDSRSALLVGLIVPHLRRSGGGVGCGLAEEDLGCLG